MLKIAILATPRTGSNLLLHSLAEHPQAVCGGEWGEQDPTRQIPEWAANKEKANLLKFMWWDLDTEGFADTVENAFKIHLYRQDKTAQFKSWERACMTGEWVKGQISPAVEVPDMDAIIMKYEPLLKSLSDISISYEYLIDNWALCLGHIFYSARWKNVPIAKITERLCARI